jgi:toxin ParE1/3/4
VHSFQITPRAEADLDEVARYTKREHGERQCAIYLGEFEARFGRLRELPVLERACDRARPGLKSQKQGRHVVFYTAESAHDGSAATLREWEPATRKRLNSCDPDSDVLGRCSCRDSALKPSSLRITRSTFSQLFTGAERPIRNVERVPERAAEEHVPGQVDSNRGGRWSPVVVPQLFASTMSPLPLYFARNMLLVPAAVGAVSVVEPNVMLPLKLPVT